MEQKNWQALRSEAASYGDRNCCAVVATASILDIDFGQAYQLFHKVGRKRGKGVNILQIKAVIAKVGATMQSVARHQEIGKPALKSKAAMKLHAGRNEGLLILTVGHIAAFSKTEGFIDFEQATKRKLEQIYTVNNISKSLRESLPRTQFSERTAVAAALPQAAPVRRRRSNRVDFSKV